MFWTLSLAHLIGDYPLQTDSLVRAKRHWWGLTLHVAIHLALMLLLAGRDSLIVWPQLLALAAAHFAIDALKNYEARRWPHLVVTSYTIDQILHFLSIILVALWIEADYGIHRDQNWLIYAAAYLSATHVWFITERVVAYRQPRYQLEVETHRWSRIFARGLTLSVYLFLGHLLLAPEVLMVSFAFALRLPPPYRCTQFRRRMLVQDLLGPLVLALLVFWFAF
ncbi:MAG: DUF3307 domain-containing protein [Chloroflexota bacterium]